MELPRDDSDVYYDDMAGNTIELPQLKPRFEDDASQENINSTNRKKLGLIKKAHSPSDAGGHHAMATLKVPISNGINKKSEISEGVLKPPAGRSPHQNVRVRKLGGSPSPNPNVYHGSNSKTRNLGSATITNEEVFEKYTPRS